MKIHLALASLGVALSLSGCGDHDRRGDREDQWDRGPTITETREVDSFDAIQVKGGLRLEIAVGQPASMTITGPERSVRRLETKVSGSTLNVWTSHKDWVFIKNNDRLTVKIGVPQLEKLQLSGGNDVRVTGFHGGKTRIASAGATHIVADGTLDKLTVRLSGAGHADLSKLIAGEAQVTVDGVGNVIVNAHEALDATMNGVGSITYIGMPQRVNTRMHGLGSISQEDADSEPSSMESKPPADPDALQPESEGQEQVDYKSKRTAII